MVTFVVGTGRSGSSALSRILSEHPDVLSLNELWASLPHSAFPYGEITGTDFWAFLSGPNEIFNRLIRSDAGLPEFLYPKKPGRYSADTGGIPALSMTVLPLLTDDPDGVLDELAPVVPAWPTRDAAGHYRALFAWLSRRFGRDVVVERSGYSTGLITRLHEVFPEAGFVHLHRNGPDCAVSMSRHSGYRMLYMLHLMAELSHVNSISGLTEEHIRALPPDLAGLFDDPFDRALLMDRPIAVESFGALWSQLVAEGAQALRALPPEQVISLSYEDLLAEPERELARLAAFAGASTDADWIASGVRELDPTRRGAALRLPPEELTALQNACVPGEYLLSAG